MTDSSLPAELHSLAPKQILHRAVNFHRSGALQDAERFYHLLLQAAPDHPDANHNLGVLAMQRSQIALALPRFEAALKSLPDQAQYWLSYVDALTRAGRLTEAEARTREMAMRFPEHGGIWKVSGELLMHLGRTEDALVSFIKAAELLKEDANAQVSFGNLFTAFGRVKEAEDSYRRALMRDPAHAVAHSNLGNLYKERGNLGEADACYRRALAITPDSAEMLTNLGSTLRDMGRPSEAEACYRRALELKPDFTAAHNNLGNVLKEQGRLMEAEASYRRALAFKPDFAAAHNNLGDVLKDLGKFVDAEISYRKALEIEPDFDKARNNLLFLISGMARCAPALCVEEASHYGRLMTKRVQAKFSAWTCEPLPQRLRVGVVSGDLRNHPVGYFLESLLTHIDPARIDLIAYPTTHQSDELTARIKPRFSGWKPLLGLSDFSAARLIHADGVHALLDLSGHTAHNRLPVFAWKPAPVQASWLGYFATTGVAEMDYLLADEVGVPETQRELFTEKLWYLPDTRLCFTPPETALPVSTLPALKNNYITFGCFQNLAKVSDDVLMAWAHILACLPGAKLRWQCKQFESHAVVAQLARRLQHCGIDIDRVALYGSVPRDAYLQAHAEVDLILDTFPYPGGTTTCEAMWMGVPTLTLAGATLLSRQGASLLTAAGLKEWVVADVTDYVDKAIAFARNVPELARLRLELRQKVSASPVFDAVRFASNLESALWGMWQEKTNEHS